LNKGRAKAFWVIKRGVAYGYKNATGAIVANGPVNATGGALRGITGTVGHFSAAALAESWNVQSLVAKTTAVAVGTQVLCLLK